MSLRPLLLALPLAFCLAVPVHAVSNPAEMLPNPAQEQRAEAIGHQLRCLVCQNESVEELEADLARDLRRIIRQRVAAGEDDQQVIDWMVARYGEFVRLRPAFSASTALLWAAPALALLAGIGSVLVLRRRRAVPEAPLSPEEQRKLSDLLRP